MSSAKEEMKKPRTRKEGEKLTLKGTLQSGCIGGKQRGGILVGRGVIKSKRGARKASNAIRKKKKK